ncbi:MAG TPA: hypothetical protein VFV38_12445 [Ktedonobacteraceae bacterium]|nr:hypothetical protein [Ktedonobacteraceae bacterium]
MNNAEPFPTFHTLRQQHGISLEALYEHGERSISLETLGLFDETGRADPYTADDILFLLSELSGQRYDRTNVGGIILVLASPPASPTHPVPQGPALPAQPTLLDLYYAYHLNLDWLGEALHQNNSEVWKVLRGEASACEEPLVEQVLHLISHYTGVAYTTENVQTWKDLPLSPPLVSSPQEQWRQEQGEQARDYPR